MGSTGWVINLAQPLFQKGGDMENKEINLDEIIMDEQLRVYIKGLETQVKQQKEKLDNTNKELLSFIKWVNCSCKHQ